MIAEFQFGLLTSRGRKRLDALFRRLESDSIVLYPDRETADWYASNRPDLKQRGRPIPENDIWVGSLARQHGLEIVSNDAHFDSIDRVKRRSW